MLGRTSTKYRRWRNEMRDQSEQEWATPEGKSQAWWHDMLFDHAYLRKFWTNFRTLDTGVYRSNHGDAARFGADIDRLGLKTIINLRGASKAGHYYAEKELCTAKGITLIDIRLNARKAPRQQPLLDLVDALETAERPVLIHCKSGADRAGLGSALYRMIVMGHPTKDARSELSFRTLHVRKSSAGIMGHVLDVYAADTADTSLPFRDWVAQNYDRERIKASFRALTWWQR